jgi:hypothetical protein
MTPKIRLILVLCVCVFLLLSIFLVPIISMDAIPCQYYSSGYTSLSYYLFNVGPTFLNGKFYWMTHSYSNCV